MVPASVPSKPPEVFVTTPALVNAVLVIEVLATIVVNEPVPGFALPIEPGEANVNPFNDEAFKLGMLVDDATTNGAVPVAIVDVNCPEAATVVNAPVAGELVPIAVP